LSYVLATKLFKFKDKNEIKDFMRSNFIYSEASFRAAAAKQSANIKRLTMRQSICRRLRPSDIGVVSALNKPTWREAVFLQLERIRRRRLRHVVLTRDRGSYKIQFSIKTESSTQLSVLNPPEREIELLEHGSHI